MRGLVLDGAGPFPMAGDHRKGVITDDDVEIIRRALHAGAGEGAFHVTRREADLLFDLNVAMRGADNSPKWRDLFVRAVGAHMMMPAPPSLGLDHHLERDAWLHDHEAKGAGGFLSVLFNPRRLSAAFRDVFSGLRDPLRDQKEMVARLEERLIGNERTRAVDAAEAEWLRRRIEADGTLDGNERALLSFVRQEASRIAPQLQPLLDRLDTAAT